MADMGVMATAITNTNPVTQVPESTAQKPARSEKKPAVKTDTVQLSAGAQAASQAQKTQEAAAKKGK
jgi:hypothetical protein